MGKAHFGRSDTPVEKASGKSVVYNTVYVDKIVEVIKEVEVEKIVTVEVEKIVEVVRLIEKIVEVIKEVPIVVFKVETVEVEIPVPVIVEKVVTILDTSMLFEERQRNVVLERKIKRLYITLAGLIVLSIILGVR